LRIGGWDASLCRKFNMVKWHGVLSVILSGAALLGVWSQSAIWAQTTAPIIPISDQPQPALLEQSSRLGILARLRAARERAQPLNAETLQEKRSQLAVALVDLQRTLSNSPSEYEQGWKAYLKWNDLTQAASDEKAADARILRAIQERMTRNHQGLEIASFVRVRDRLRDFGNALEANRQGKSGDAYTQVINDLAERYERFQQQPNSTDLAEMGRDLSWLHSTGREPELVAEIQREFSAPNVEVLASSGFLARAATRPVNQTSSVTDVILKTRIHGTAHMVGHTSVTPAESWQRGLLCLNLTGTVCSNNIGVNGPATLHTTGITTVNAVKPILFDINGLTLLPATANCTTSTNIHSIETRSRIVEKMAWKRAGKQQSEAEAIASDHAEARIARQLDEEVARQLADANVQFENKVRKPAVRRGVWPQDTQVSSNSSGVMLRMLHGGAGKLAAPGTPPSMTRSHDVTVKAHESAVANLSSELVGGFELTDENVVQLLKENNREIPEELKITDESEPWSITFARYAPVAVKFDANQIHIAVRCDRFTKGKNEDGTPDQEINTPVEIAANYKLYQGPLGLLLVRDGEVTVDFVGQKKLTAMQVATKTFLKRKFNSVFKADIAGEGITLPGALAAQGKMTVREVATHAGWIVAGIEQ
jgi:hypothetical protein